MVDRGLGRRRALERWAAAPPRFWALGGGAIALAVALVGCSVFETPRVPRPCGAVFSEVRCQALLDAAAARLQVTREDVTSIEIPPDPTPQVVDGRTILTMGSGLRLRITLADGTSHDLTMCVGVAMEPECQGDPALRVSTPTANGYFDTPEGSSPVPGPAADALAAAVPFHLDRRDISVDHVGRHEIRLGEALLPNGLLTTAELELVDDWPRGLSLVEGVVRLEVREAETGEPLWNVFIHGWREGTERIEVFLVFDVFHVDPGAVLSIRDVNVE